MKIEGLSDKGYKLPETKNKDDHRRYEISFSQKQFMDACKSIGAMVLNDGLYNGNRIISEEYLKDMLSPHLKLGERFGFMNYGYLWYKPYDDKEVYAAIGDSGNIIYINKEKKVSVGVTGTFKPRIFDRVDFIEQKVLPAIGVG